MFPNVTLALHHALDNKKLSRQKLSLSSKTMNLPSYRRYDHPHSIFLYHIPIITVPFFNIFNIASRINKINEEY